MIGGNTFLTIKKKQTGTLNAYGERQNSYTTLIEIAGWLDLESGTSEYSKYSKIPNSSHIFLADYIDIGESDLSTLRAECDGKTFDVLYVDDPMNLHKHLEIFLKELI